MGKKGTKTRRRPSFCARSLVSFLEDEKAARHLWLQLRSEDARTFFGSNLRMNDAREGDVHLWKGETRD